MGQPLGIVAAETEEQARAAAAAVVVEYEDLPAILDIEDAIAGKLHKPEGNMGTDGCCVQICNLEFSGCLMLHPCVRYAVHGMAWGHSATGFALCLAPVCAKSVASVSSNAATTTVGGTARLPLLCSLLRSVPSCLAFHGVQPAATMMVGGTAWPAGMWKRRSAQQTANACWRAKPRWAAR